MASDKIVFSTSKLSTGSIVTMLPGLWGRGGDEGVNVIHWLLLVGSRRPMTSDKIFLPQSYPQAA